MTDAIPLLVDRVSQLDSQPIYADLHGDVDPQVAHFVRTMQRVTSPGVTVDVQRLPTTLPGDADGIVARSSLLQRLAAAMPEVVAGPLDRDRQFWVATARPAHLPARWPALERSRFVPPSEAPSPAVGPPGVGLFTSTGGRSGYGMWFDHLRLNSGSSLHPRPWQVWWVPVAAGARVLEIRTATEWVELVGAYGRRQGDVIAPDWAGVATQWDGVHMTARAVAATQGVWFHAGGGLVSAPHWDVESTLWLRWVFADPTLVDEMAE